MAGTKRKGSATKRLNNTLKRLKVNRSIMTGATTYNRTGGFARMSGPNELKFKDTIMSFAVKAVAEIPATGGQFALIAQGDGPSERDGRNCVIKSIEMRLILNYLPVNTGTGACIVTMYVVEDTQTNGAAAAFSSVFVNGVSPTGAVTAYPNLETQPRFRILKKWDISMHSNVLIPTGSTTNLPISYAAIRRTVNYYKKVNVAQTYNAATGTIAALQTNNLFLIAGCNGEDGDKVNVIGNTRIRFTG